MNKEAIVTLQKMKSYIATQEELDHINMAIKALEQSEWIPVITRDLDDEEIEEIVENSDRSIDGIEPWCYVCKLPDDGQTVIISTPLGIRMTEFYADDYYGYYFEGYEDRGDVTAWMPLPEPYKEAKNER